MLTGRPSPFILTASFQSRTRQHTAVTWNKLDSNSSVRTVWTSEDYGELTTDLVFSSLSRADTGTYSVSVTNNHELVGAKQRTVSVDFNIIITGAFYIHVIDKSNSIFSTL